MEEKYLESIQEIIKSGRKIRYGKTLFMALKNKIEMGFNGTELSLFLKHNYDIDASPNSIRLLKHKYYTKEIQSNNLICSQPLDYIKRKFITNKNITKPIDQDEQDTLDLVAKMKAASRPEKIVFD